MNVETHIPPAASNAGNSHRQVRVHGPEDLLRRVKIPQAEVDYMLGKVFEVERTQFQASGFPGSVRLVNGWTIPFGCYTYVD